MTQLSRSHPGEIPAALSAWLDGSSAIVAAELDDNRTVAAANATFSLLAETEPLGTPIREFVSAAQQDALDRLLDQSGQEWQRSLLGLFPDAHGIPLDFAISTRRLASGWLLIAEPALQTTSTVNEQLLALNDELARAQRQIRRQNAELAHQNDKLRELDTLKDTLLANVSHDLRTPLTAILGYAELLRRRGGLTEQQARAANVIERNARRLLRMVNGLLLLASQRAGQLTLDREPVDLVQLANEALELAQPLATEADVDLRLDTQSPTTRIDGDRMRLTQLLDNLLANAIKFSPNGGQVTVRVWHDASTACLEIEDDGPGIPADTLEHLYQPFATGSGNPRSGTGLGLAIVRAIADAHQATINLDSQPQRGTRFNIRFPRRRDALKNQDPGPSIAGSSASPRTSRRA
jgi:signal transduction histidine kinase